MKKVLFFSVCILQSVFLLSAKIHVSVAKKNNAYQSVGFFKGNNEELTNSSKANDQETLEKLKKMLDDSSLSLMKEDEQHAGYYVLNRDTKLTKETITELFDLLYQVRNLIKIDDFAAGSYNYYKVSSAFFIDYFVFLQCYEKDKSGIIQSYVNFIDLIKSIGKIPFEQMYEKYRVVENLINTLFGSFFALDALDIFFADIDHQYSYNFSKYDSHTDLKTIEETHKKLSEVYSRVSKVTHLSLQDCSDYFNIFVLYINSGGLCSNDQYEMSIRCFKVIADYKKESVFVSNQKGFKKKAKERLSQKRIEYLTIDQLNEQVAKHIDLESKNWALSSLDAVNKRLTLPGLKALLANKNYWIIKDDGSLHQKTLLDEKVLLLMLHNLTFYARDYYIGNFYELQRYVMHWGLDYPCLSELKNLATDPAIKGYIKLVESIKSNFEKMVYADYEVIQPAVTPLPSRNYTIPSGHLVAPLNKFTTDAINIPLMYSYDVTTYKFLYTEDQLRKIAALRQEIDAVVERFKTGANVSLADISAFFKTVGSLDDLDAKLGDQYTDVYTFIFKNVALMAKKNNVILTEDKK